jgi:hypothetical protein
MDAATIASEIRRRLGERIEQPAEVLAEIERVVAERPSTCARVRVAVELELMRARKDRAA